MKPKNRFCRAAEKLPVPPSHKRKKHPITSIKAANLLSLLFILQGAVCLLFTQTIHAVFPGILGTTMVIFGFCDIYRGVRSGEFRDQETKLTASGIVMAILGAVILLRRRNADSIIGSIWGVLGLTKGSEELNLAICHAANGSPFAKELLHGALELLLALALLLDPLTAVGHHLFLLGFELILYGVQLRAEARKAGQCVSPP